MGCGRVFICITFALSLYWTANTYVVGPLLGKRDENSMHPTKLRIVENVPSGTVLTHSDSFHWEAHLCRWSSLVLHRTAIVLDVFLRDVVPAADEHNIFLLETGCSSTLNFRSLCALESFLKNNPFSTVWFLVTSATQDDSDALLRRLYEYPNLRLAALDLNLLFEGTPLEEFYKSSRLLESNLVNVHMSDIARLAVVWRYGGFYSDNDVICLKSVLYIKNTLAFESMDSVANAFFHFERNHPFLKQYMTYILTHYEPDEWTSIGPKAVTAILSSKCGMSIKDRDFWNTSPECGYVNLLSSQAIQPLPWTEYKRIFKDEVEKPISELYPDTYVMHLTGSSSNRIPVDVVLDKSFYAKASQEHCPIVYGDTTLRNRFI